MLRGIVDDWQRMGALYVARQVDSVVGEEELASGTMRQQETQRRLRRALRFSRAWFDTGLMTGDLIRLQFASLRRHYGPRSRPVRASEHWRYGAFLYCLRRVQDEAGLKRLMLAASSDRDRPMAKAMMKEIAAHPLYRSHIL